MAKNKEILSVNNISVFYGQICAVRNVSIDIRENEIMGLIGANGAGKSTLMKAVLGIKRCTEGSINFMEQDITKSPTPRIVSSGIAYVPEGGGVFPHMSVLENLDLGTVHFKGDYNERLEKIFERFPLLRERQHQQAGTLSGGQRQIAAIGRALMSSPKLIMFDEPSLGLAPIMVEELFRLILDLRDDGHTILLSEQNARKTLQHADRACVFQTGSIVLKGNRAELADNPVVQQAYLGG